MLTALLLALLQNPDVPTMATPTDRACPFVVITISGGPIDSFDKPHTTGKMASFRVCPAGRTVTYPAKDVDWAATEKANAPRVVAAPTPNPEREVSGLASGMKTQTGEEMEKRQMQFGQLRTKTGKAMSINSDYYFAENSVAQHLRASQLVATTDACPDGQMLIYGSVTNTSRMKLRDLRGAMQIVVVYRDRDLTQKTEVLVEQIQSLEPAELMPGDGADIMVHIPCKTVWRGLLSKQTRYQDPQYLLTQGMVYTLRDVAGKAEPLASPETDPFPIGTPKPKEVSRTAPTPTPGRAK